MTPEERALERQKVNTYLKNRRSAMTSEQKKELKAKWRAQYELNKAANQEKSRDRQRKKMALMTVADKKLRNIKFRAVHMAKRLGVDRTKVFELWGIT